MDILLIRHGECENSLCFNEKRNRPDPKLTERGRAQASMLGRRLAGCGIARIYTSDLARAAETAEIVTGYVGAPIETREELREIDMGKLHRLGWEDIRKEDPALYDAWHRHWADIPYPGGESGGDVAARAMPVIDEIVSGGHGTVAVVTHGGVIRALICALLGIAQEKRFRFGPPENTSVSVVRYGPGSGSYDIFSMNDFSHLNE